MATLLPSTRARQTFEAHGGVLRTSEALRLGVHPATLYAMRDALTAVNRVQNMLLNSEVRAHLKEIGHDADACNSYLTDVKRSFDNTRKAYKKTFFGDAS